MSKPFHSVCSFNAFVSSRCTGSGVLGLLHISEIEHVRTNNVADVLQVEQELEVSCARSSSNDAAHLAYAFSATDPALWTKSGLFLSYQPREPCAC